MNKSVAFAAIAMLFALGVHLSYALAQQDSVVVKTMPLSAPTSDQSPELSGADMARINEALQRSEKRIYARLEALKPGLFDKLLGLIGAVIGAAAAILLQFIKNRADDRAWVRSSGLSGVASIMEFRSRQLNEFYAPLRALHAQGLGIRNELYRQLKEANVPGVEFRYVTEAIAATGQSLWVKYDGKDKPFRFIDDLELVRNHFPQLMSMVDQIIEVGNKSSKLIQTRAGLALPENQKLTEMLGSFLAHHAILKKIREAVGKGENVTYTAAYPRGFDKLIADDCTRLTTQLQEWEDLSRKMLDIEAK